MENNNEIWKDIPGYEGLYQVSNMGQVKSCKINKHFRNRVLKKCIASNGYHVVNLLGKTHLVHRLVAQAFLPNPNNYPCINHIDENRLNNQVNNLEWCTYSYNNTYNNNTQKKLDTLNKRNRQSKEKPVVQFTKDGCFIAIYKSISDAAKKNGLSKGNIGKCVKVGGKKYNSTGGYKWKYLEDYENKSTDLFISA